MTPKEAEQTLSKAITRLMIYDGLSPMVDDATDALEALMGALPKTDDQEKK